MNSDKAVHHLWHGSRTAKTWPCHSTDFQYADNRLGVRGLPTIAGACNGWLFGRPTHAAREPDLGVVAKTCRYAFPKALWDV
jgi:hypothetical protein